MHYMKYYSIAIILQNTLKLRILSWVKWIEKRMQIGWKRDAKIDECRHSSESCCHFTPISSECRMLHSYFTPSKSVAILEKIVNNLHKILSWINGIKMNEKVINVAIHQKSVAILLPILCDAECFIGILLQVKRQHFSAEWQ